LTIVHYVFNVVMVYLSHHMIWLCPGWCVWGSQRCQAEPAASQAWTCSSPLQPVHPLGSWRDWGSSGAIHLLWILPLL